MSKRGEQPQNGPAKALWDADPDDDFEDIFEAVDRWECDNCGKKRFVRLERCGCCGCQTFNRVSGGNDG